MTADLRAIKSGSAGFLARSVPAWQVSCYCRLKAADFAQLLIDSTPQALVAAELRQAYSLPLHFLLTKLPERYIAEMMSPLPPLTPAEPDDEILVVLARSLGCDVVDVERIASDGRLTPALMAEVPRPLALALQALPVWSTSEILWVAVADPMNLCIQSYFEPYSKKLIKPVLARGEDVERLIQEHYGTADKGDQEVMALTLAEHLGWGLVDLEDLEARGGITRELLAQIPADLARNAGAFPVAYTHKTVRVAMADPLEPVNLMLVKATLRKRVQPVVVARGDIHFLIMWYYGEKG